MRLCGLLGLWALALAIGAPLGCATVPACPAKGGPAWHELTSEHFVLRTDQDEEDALVVLRRLEDARAAMLGIVWPRAPALPGRVQAIALASDDEVAAYTGPQAAAVHLRMSPFPPTLLLPGVGKASERIANHELAHALSLQLMPLQPRWFAEGLAEYLSTIHREDEDQGRAVAGDALVDRYLFIRQYGVSSVAILLGPVPRSDLELQRFYATSWLLVHYLINTRPEQLERFERRLLALEPARTAFGAEFPDLVAGKLEGVLKEYMFSGKYIARMRPIPAWNGEHQTRVLSDAEVHGARAMLEATIGSNLGHGEGWLAAARADVAEALQDPRPPIEAFVLAFEESRLAPLKMSTEKLVKRAVEIHPESWMSWWMMARLSDYRSPARQEALRHALALNPGAPEALADEALELSLAKRWQETLRITNELLPDGVLHHDVWLLHLQALLNTGHCREAEIWGAALQGYLDAKEAGAVAGMRAKATCGQVVTPAASQAAGAHTGERS